MNDYVRELLERELSEHRIPYNTSAEYQEFEPCLAYWYGQVEKALGPDSAEILSELEADRTRMENEAFFQHGFRLAVRLLLT